MESTGRDASASSDVLPRTTRPELENWIVDMDVMFRARTLEEAMMIAHIVASEVEQKVQDSKVFLGENYRHEPIQ